MTIWFAGDPHGGTIFLRDALRFCRRPDGIILLGDNMFIEPIAPRLPPQSVDIPIRWIHGNHDTDSEDYAVQAFGKGNIHGRVIHIGGVRIAGLGGVFRGEIWSPPDPPRYRSYDDWHGQWSMDVPPRHRMSPSEFLAHKRPRRHRSTIFPADFEMLAGQQADVLVTHEAPSCHQYGFAVIDELAGKMEVKAIVHGHHHKHCRAELPGGIAVTGVADRMIVDSDGNVVWS